MHKTTRAAALATAVGGMLVGLVVAPGSATAAGGNRVIHVTATHTKVTFEAGTTVAPGFAIFNVQTPRGHHGIQLAQLADGYTRKEFKEDSIKGFEKNRLNAIARIYKNVAFEGGATASADHPARFAVVLKPGVYLVLGDDDVFTRLTVTDGPAVAGGVDFGATFRAADNSDGMPVWRLSDKTIPNRGWLKFKNRSAQTHFVILQQVKRTTTRSDVTEFFQSGDQGDPPWIRPDETETGLIATGQKMFFHYGLHPGRYIVICFMPDVHSGAPHGVMGMFRLINLVRS
jgi:hypothetical protein